MDKGLEKLDKTLDKAIKQLSKLQKKCTCYVSYNPHTFNLKTSNGLKVNLLDLEEIVPEKYQCDCAGIIDEEVLNEIISE